MYDPHTRESRGFGFVTMVTAEEADAAIAGLHNTELQGKVMRVEKVRSLLSHAPLVKILAKTRCFAPRFRPDEDEPELLLLDDTSVLPRTTPEDLLLPGRTGTTGMSDPTTPSPTTHDTPVRHPPFSLLSAPSTLLTSSSYRLAGEDRRYDDRRGGDSYRDDRCGSSPHLFLPLV
jgi:RNA recognition motif-containing protein